MTTIATPAADGTVPLAGIEQELARQLHTVKEPGEAPVQRAHMSNLVIFCNSAQLADGVQEGDLRFEGATVHEVPPRAGRGIDPDELEHRVEAALRSANRGMGRVGFRSRQR